MASLSDNIHALAASAQWSQVPRSIEAFSELVDDQKRPLITLLFSTHRDLITQIAYRPADGCPELLSACASAICQLVKDKPVMEAELIRPEDIGALLGEHALEDDGIYYHILLSIVLLKDALSSYANHRARDYQEWKNSRS